MSSEKDDSTTALILTEVRGLSATVTTLVRHVDNLGQQITAMRKNTDLIPAIINAVGETSSDVDDHEKRLKDHDKRIVKLEHAAN
jgi:hypothetical protein